MQPRISANFRERKLDEQVLEWIRKWKIALRQTEQSFVCSLMPGLSITSADMDYGQTEEERGQED